LAVAPALRRLGNAGACGEPLRGPVGREGPNRGLYHTIRGGKRLYRDPRCLVGPYDPRHGSPTAEAPRRRARLPDRGAQRRGQTRRPERRASSTPRDGSVSNSLSESFPFLVESHNGLHKGHALRSTWRHPTTAIVDNWHAKRVQRRASPLPTSVVALGKSARRSRSLPSERSVIPGSRIGRDGKVHARCRP